jgi:hypothetical protein
MSFAALALGAAPALAAIEVESTSYADGATIPARYGGSQGDCGGHGVSPQVSWRKLPSGTRSIAIVIFDIDGANGLGVSHWVVYNVDASRGRINEGEGQASGPGISVGPNQAGGAAYRGMCPPVGDVAHHYILTVIATDIPPGGLPDGMNRHELWQRLKGHALGAQSLVGRYAR